MTPPPPRVALLCGASGLVGGYCLTRLVASPVYGRVVVLTRRTLPVVDPKVAQVVVDFAQLATVADQLAADHVFCALGTTIKKAGSRERFRTVDYGYPTAIAHLTRDRGARHFSLVSALGASPSSRVFYSRVKGELEATVRTAGFASVTILRPSVITGPRRESRPAERLSRWLLALAPRAVRPVHADTIATAMVARAIESRPGVEVIASRDIAAAAHAGGS